MTSAVTSIKAVKHITLDEFYHALGAVWHPQRAIKRELATLIKALEAQQGSTENKSLSQKSRVDLQLSQAKNNLEWHGKANDAVGLAVSGGADSMALAQLFASARHKAKTPANFKCRAFVVDHQARPGSAEEARLVAHRLRKLGIPTTTLKVEWPQNSSGSSFESKARTLRYRALGRACSAFKIRSLLLAHHANDQAETILMRLLNGRTDPTALCGINSTAKLPECHEMFDVSLTGVSSSDIIESIATNRRGINIHRPLLDFEKTRLVETCVSSGTEWVEDPTNTDTKMSERNLLRAWIKENRLPQALCPHSLLKLREAREKTQVEEVKIVEETFRKLQLSLSTATGRAALTLPDRQIKQLNDRSDSLLPTLLRKCAELVSPHETVDLSPFATVAAEVSKTSEQPLTRVTAASTMWLPMIDQAARSVVWMIERRPHPRHIRKPSLSWTSASNTGLDCGAFGTWQLFDGRFWIRIDTTRHERVHLRALHAKDLKHLKKEIPALERILESAAPGSCRFTLPVIAIEEAPSDKAVALPSLGLKSPTAYGIRWRILYKNFVDQPKRLSWQLQTGRFDAREALRQVQGNGS